jgi:hypothetical protein
MYVPSPSLLFTREQMCLQQLQLSARAGEGQLPSDMLMSNLVHAILIESVQGMYGA